MEIVKRLQKKIVYDPRVQVFHHRRPLFLPHLRQIARYALHRGYFARHFPSTSRRISYTLPSLFVVGLAVGGILAGLHPFCGMVYAGAVLVYLLATLGASARRNPWAWLCIWLGIVLTHMVYGIRFMMGFFARRLPGDVHDFDHASQKRSREAPN